MPYQYIDMDRNRLGGIPTIRNTRFSVAQLLAEMADGSSPQEVADTFDLNKHVVVGVVRELSMLLNTVDNPLNNS